MSKRGQIWNKGPCIVRSTAHGPIESIVLQRTSIFVSVWAISPISFVEVHFLVLIKFSISISIFFPEPNPSVIVFLISTSIDSAREVSSLMLIVNLLGVLLMALLTIFPFFRQN